MRMLHVPLCRDSARSPFFGGCATKMRQKKFASDGTDGTDGVEFGAQVDNVEAGGFFAAFGRERGET